LAIPEKQGSLTAVNLPPSVDKLVGVTELDSYTPCHPNHTTFQTFLTVDFIGEASRNTNATDLQEQYSWLQHAVLQSYNNLNSFNTGNVCDTFFLTITDAQIIVSPNESGYGLTSMNRRHLKQNTSINSNFVFHIRGRCRGCPGDSPLLFYYGIRQQRQLDEWPLTAKGVQLEKQNETLDTLDDERAFLEKYRGYRRRLPIVSGGCFCPIGTTHFRRPTQSEFVNSLNIRLRLLEAANLTNTIVSATEANQDVPVSCSSEVNFFNDTVDVTLREHALNSTNLTSTQEAQLTQAFLTSYNSLAQQYCDPLFRTIYSVQLVGVAQSRRVLGEKDGMRARRGGNRLLAPSSAHGSASNSTGVSNAIVIFDIRGRCRGCPPSTTLFSNAVGHRRMLDYVTFVKNTVNASGERVTGTSSRQGDSEEFRHLQDVNQTVRCYCNFFSLESRAPKEPEFIKAYNRMLASLDIPATVTLINEQTIAALPTLTPTSQPVVPNSTQFSLPTTSPTFSPMTSTACSSRDYFRFRRSILVTFLGRPGSVSDADVDKLQNHLVQAYNQAAACHNAFGGFRRLRRAKILRNQITSFGSSSPQTPSAELTQNFTVTATVQGECRGCKASPFRLFSDKSTPRRMHCVCPIPLKSSILHFFNRFVRYSPSEIRRMKTVLPSSIDLLEDITELESYSPCNPTEDTFHTFITIDFTEETLNITDQSQNPILEQAVLQSYNNLNALGTADVCDNFFVTITDVQVVVSPKTAGYGLTSMNRRNLKQSAAVSTKDFIFSITGKCRGCLGNPPSLFDDVSGRRRHLNQWPMTIMEEKQQSHQQTTQAQHDVSDVSSAMLWLDSRRLPVVSGGCYCPVYATQFRRPTQSEFVNSLNIRLRLLEAANLINIVGAATETLQDVPVNCSSEENFFNDTVGVTLGGYALNSTNLSSTQEAQLTQAFITSYNSLAQQYCDPLFRTIYSVQLEEVIQSRRVLCEKEGMRTRSGNNRLLAPSSAHGSASKPTGVSEATFVFSVTGHCRGCPSSTPLFNDAIVAGRMLDYLFVIKETPTTSREHAKATSQQGGNERLRQLQETNLTAECYCDLNSLGDRAPNETEFTEAFAEMLASANIASSVITISQIIPPSPTNIGPTDSIVTKTTNLPTVISTPSPTAAITKKPTTSLPAINRAPPSTQPSLPSVQPSRQPSETPFSLPLKSFQPSFQPSETPFSRPLKSVQPSFQQSETPFSRPLKSVQPSFQPSETPFSLPLKSVQPSFQSPQSDQPSAQPSETPFSLPLKSVQPSFQSPQSDRPSAQPSETPFSLPLKSIQPSLQPSETPFSQPSFQPSETPFRHPLKSVQPSSQPSETPFIHPLKSVQPSSQPSETPFSRPLKSVQPSFQPSQTPFSLPPQSDPPSETPSLKPHVLPP
jgi:Fe-S cluster biogenesis protein NfuA